VCRQQFETEVDEVGRYSLVTSANGQASPRSNVFIIRHHVHLLPLSLISVVSSMKMQYLSTKYC